MVLSTFWFPCIVIICIHANRQTYYNHELEQHIVILFLVYAFFYLVFRLIFLLAMRSILRLFWTFCCYYWQICPTFCGIWNDTIWFPASKTYWCHTWDAHIHYVFRPNLKSQSICFFLFSSFEVQNDIQMGCLQRTKIICKCMALTAYWLIKLISCYDDNNDRELPIEYKPLLPDVFSHFQTKELQKHADIHIPRQRTRLIWINKRHKQNHHQNHTQKALHMKRATTTTKFTLFYQNWALSFFNLC